MSADIAAMAERVIDDGAVPNRDRICAARVLHQLRHGLRIDPRDAWRLRCAHRRHRRWLITLGFGWR